MRVGDGGQGVGRAGKDGHHAVAEALDDLAGVLAHRRLDRLRNLAKELDRRVVARLHRPVRELDQVGKEDREVGIDRNAARAGSERVPHLERGEPSLAQDAGLLGRSFGEPATELLA